MIVQHLITLPRPPEVLRAGVASVVYNDNTETREIISVSLPEYQFRNVADGVHFATASDRYAGWIGQIYSADKDYKIKKSQKSVKGKKVAEEKVPVRSVAEYFQHYDALEIDFTFYAYLLKQDGTPSRTMPVLEEYDKYIPLDGLVLLKVPQAITAPRTWQQIDGKRKFADNPDYLNAEKFTDLFYKPVLNTLGDRAAAFIFERPYQRKANCPPSDENIAELQEFFDSIPPDDRYHIEERTDRLKTEDYFQFLQSRGIANVFSHWTWLPDLKTQWEQAGGFSGAMGIIRLLTPLNMKYDDTYERYAPFNKLIDEFPEMYRDAAMIIHEGQDAGLPTVTVANNRAGGNSNEITRRVVEAMMDE